MHADARRRTMGFLVPFGRDRDQFAVAVTFDDVDNYKLRERAGWMQLLVMAFEPPFVAQLTQDTLEDGTVVVLQAEGAGDLANADLAGLFADESDNLLL